MTMVFAGAMLATLMVAMPSFAQEPSQALRPQARPENAPQWTRLVSAHLQRRAGVVVAASRQHGIVGNYSLKIGFNLLPDGSVSDVHLVEGSGEEKIDAAALRIPGLSVPFPEFTADMSRQPKPIVAPFLFRLTPKPPAPAAP